VDFGDISSNLPFIIAVVVLILFQFFIKRKRSPAASNTEIVQNFLSEIRFNIRLIERFTFNQGNKKFFTTTWKINKEKLDFLEQSLRSDLSTAFIMAEEINEKITAAKKFKSTSYLASIDVDKMKGPLSRSQEGLAEWLQSEAGTAEEQITTPNILDDLLGKR